MAYLTGWRLALAADLLRETDATVGAVARRSATAALRAEHRLQAGPRRQPAGSTASAPSGTNTGPRARAAAGGLRW